MAKKKVLITGAAGLVGSQLRKFWGDIFELRLADIKPIDNLAAYEEFVEMDITKYDEFLAACAGVDTVVHLAADRSPSAEFYKTLLDLNIIGCYNGFEAVRAAGCRRIVFASSINAILGYRYKERTFPHSPIFPLNVYGATKCFGEALGQVYVHQHGLSCIMVRLSSPRFDQDGDWDPADSNDMLSPRDNAQLFRRCVEVENVDFAIVHGASRHQSEWMDLEETSQLLGYEPQDGTAFPKGSA